MPGKCSPDDGKFDGLQKSFSCLHYRPQSGEEGKCRRRESPGTQQIGCPGGDVAGFDCDTLVVGGGISGLAAALTLKEKGQDVRLLESRGYLGGAIRSVRDQGYLLEFGPNSLMVRPDDDIDAVFGDPDLMSGILSASTVSKNRFVVKSGKPVPLPLSPWAFLRTPLLSWRGRLDVLREWRVPARTGGPEETLSHFVRRRLGEEVLQYFIDPFVKGVYASHPDLLSVDAAFPLLVRLEKEHGGLFRGGLKTFLKRRKEPSGHTPRGIFSFSGGMSDLVEAIGKKLGEDVGTNVDVVKYTRLDEGFRVALMYDETEYYMTSRRLVLATSALHAAELLEGDPDGPSVELSAIPYAPVTVVYAGYGREQVLHPLDGFGLLCPTAENRKVLGVIFSSSLFPGRAPEGKVLLTVFVGGMTGQKLAQAFDEDLERIVRKELAELLGVTGAPEFFRIHRWEKAIPQYVLGHEETVRTIRKKLPPGLRLAGNYLEGISVARAFGSGVRAAKDLLSEG
jgi:oxygen-dependent protoporphyrinogen oxidase